MEQAAWQYSQTHQAILGPFGELLTEDDLVHLEKQIAHLQQQRHCQEYQSELGWLAAELQALLPMPLASITVNSHLLPQAPRPEGEEAAAAVSDDLAQAGGQPLPSWCGHIIRLMHSMSLLLKDMNGLTQAEDRPQDTPREAPDGPPQSAAQHEIRECGVSMQTLRSHFELAPDPHPPCTSSPGPGKCPSGCWAASAGGPVGGEPRLSNAEAAGDSGTGRLNLGSLRKERIITLFLSHWKRSAYTPALETAASRTLKVCRAWPRSQEVARGLRPFSPPLCGGPRLWQQCSAIAHLLGSWKAIMVHVPARQLRRLSRRPHSPLSPEQFLPHADGAPVPYSHLTLDLFMLGYFQLLECELPPEERKTRHLLCFEVFKQLGAHGWEAMRAFHKAVTDEVAAGCRTWADSFDDIKARFFGSSRGLSWDTEPGREMGLAPLGPLPPATTATPCGDPRPMAQQLGPSPQWGSFTSEDICGFIDRSFTWKEKEAEMFNFGE